MSEDAGTRIREAIRDHGPITFAEFMEHALYGPGGFYQRPPVGCDGHFVTSPHVHTVFADLLRAALTEMWECLGRPDPFRVVELGAGDGTLARSLLTGFETPVDYTAVERSAGARAVLSELPIRVEEDFGVLEDAVVFANELLDNLPFRRVRRTGAGLVEVRVGLDGNELVEVETPMDEELAAPAPALARGDEATVPEGALRLIGSLAERVSRGYVLLVDYGAGGAPAGEVHGYREHRVLEDVLAEPGAADVTAGVDFAAVGRRAEETGLTTLGLVPQWRALRALGYERWTREQLSRQAELLHAGRGLEAVRVWGGRSRASLLADPAALGRLRWLLLATPGLPRPNWLVEALREEPSAD